MNLSFAHHRRQFISPPHGINFMDARVDAGAPPVNAPNSRMPKALSKYLRNPIELFDFSVHHTTENDF